jgi:NAD(P)-dependent dehydrogenase (short-subunit alcohol dehydrogenase family)
MSAAEDAQGVIVTGPEGALSGKVVFIAGSTGSVGRAVAHALAAAGASVAVHYRSNPAAAEALAAELSTPSLAVGAEISDAEQVDAAFTAVEAELGAVDILVNLAHAHMEPTPFLDTTDAQLTGQLDSVKGYAFLVQRALPKMRSAGWGRVVYLSGALMVRLNPGFAAYGAAKSAATTLTKGIALEEGRFGITANVIAPGRIVDPADTEPLLPEWQAFADKLLERMALKEFPDTNDVAAMVSLLVGPGSRHLTGQVLWATGGELVG